MAWLEGFTRAEYGGYKGNAYSGGKWKLVLHCTQGGANSDKGLTGRGGWYDQRATAGRPLHPHFTINADPEYRTRYQHVDTARSAYALRDKSGGVRTNRDRAINIEMIGFSEQTPDWPDEWYEWIAREVIAPIVRAHPSIDVEDTPEFPDSSKSYGLNSQYRFTNAQWLKATGIVGHVHVPENTHSDPGAIKTHILIEETLKALGTPPTSGGSAVVTLADLPTDPFDAAAPSSTYNADVETVQRWLKARSLALANPAFDPGPIDGLTGTRTGAAVQAWKRQVGIVRDGSAQWTADVIAATRASWGVATAGTPVPVTPTPMAPEIDVELAAILEQIVALYEQATAWIEGKTK